METRVSSIIISTVYEIYQDASPWVVDRAEFLSRLCTPHI